MWFFNSPEFVFGEGALSYLEGLQGRRACLVTDETLARLGLAERVCQAMPPDLPVDIYTEIESDPSLETVQRGAQFLLACQPDWIIALGGGSVLDAAKAMWVLYENPTLTPEEINPIEQITMRRKAHLIAIPTTSGTGSEATWAVVLTDAQEKRKLGLGNRENLPDVAILDPELVLQMPPRLTADTALDALTHAIEGYTSAWRNDFSDGLCLKAAQLVFDYLPAAYRNGEDVEARTRLQNAAAIAGLGFGNSMAALAHGMGHALGGVFHVPHGRAVALFLPYTIEYCACEPGGSCGITRFAELASFLRLSLPEDAPPSYGAASDPADSLEAGAAAALAAAVRALEQAVDQPLTIAECGITREALEGALDLLVENALNDTQTIMSTRIPESDDLRKLFLAAYQGSKVDF